MDDQELALQDRTGQARRLSTTTIYTVLLLIQSTHVLLLLVLLIYINYITYIDMGN